MVCNRVIRYTTDWHEIKLVLGLREQCVWSRTFASIQLNKRQGHLSAYVSSYLVKNESADMVKT